MNSPFPAAAARPGTGRIVVNVSPHGHPSLETVAYQYPLKLIAPDGGGGGDPTDPKSALVFLLSYGGGLVGGDQVHLDMEVRSGARLSLVTQGSTKVFKAVTDKRADTTRQHMDICVGPDAGVCLLPDPVQPFADSDYEQIQTVRLAAGNRSSVCLLDWVTEGRAARGEHWSLQRWTGRNEIYEDGRLLVRDAVYLDRQTLKNSMGLRASMHGLAVVGTLLLRGPLVEALGQFFLDEFGAQPRLGERDWKGGKDGKEEETRSTFESDNNPESWRRRRRAMEQQHSVLWTAAGVRGCVVVKFGARSVEGARLWVGAMLGREGSIAEAFGAEALMCLR